jgi:hypothetical protein
MKKMKQVNALREVCGLVIKTDVHNPTDISCVLPPSYQQSAKNENIWCVAPQTGEPPWRFGPEMP